jgi:hypothetical protein
MKVINIHQRIIHQPKSAVVELFNTLASKNDLMLATNKWPAMKLDIGLTVGSKGGHGPIRYTIEAYSPGEFIQFRFSKPRGFHGFHRFDIVAIDTQTTEIRHELDMNTSGLALLTWPLVIRWLHDALIEDAFDKTENHFLSQKKTTRWSAWVKLLRWLLK